MKTDDYGEKQIGNYIEELKDARILSLFEILL
jgi:hypothetical protein